MMRLWEILSKFDVYAIFEKAFAVCFAQLVRMRFCWSHN